MQVEFVQNVVQLYGENADKALLCSSTGEGFIILTGDEKLVNTRVYGISEACLFSYIS